MKETKNKSVKKAVRDDIASGLIKQLKTLTGKFGEASEKLSEEIEKGAKKLAKKIAKEVKIITTPATPKEDKPVKKTVPAKVAPHATKAAPVKAAAKPATKKKV
ncbi:MAG TPA: hypothetical protein VK668_21630 [Mucilaginibacter sp.]|nr:hypothetical protein [Mucilaginibacter sp.]